MKSSSPVVDLIIPVRSLADGKRRLRTLLNAEQRQQLNRQFLMHALTIARQLPGLGHIWVVSACARTLDLARHQGACALKEPINERYGEAPEARLNNAMNFAFAKVRDRGARDILVVSVDLPLAQTKDLSSLCRQGRSTAKGRCVIATDEAGQGTNAIFIPERGILDFSFGPDSCRRHAENARQHGMQAHIAKIANLACDIDTPDDYLRWRDSPSCSSNLPTLSGVSKWMRCYSASPRTVSRTNSH